MRFDRLRLTGLRGTVRLLLFGLDGIEFLLQRQFRVVLGIVECPAWRRLFFPQRRLHERFDISIVGEGAIHLERVRPDRRNVRLAMLRVLLREGDSHLVSLATDA